VLNGEIYNLSEVKTRFLPDFQFRTTSDTEVLLESIVRHDCLEVLDAIRGMFAFAVFKSHSQKLLLFRDRFGEKPMHYWSDGNQILFSSQYDTIAQAMKLLNLPVEFDQESIYRYLILGYFPYENSLIKGIRKLAPGSMIEFSTNERSFSQPDEKRWFKKWQASESEEIDFSVFSQVFERAVAEQLIGDVPIGVFLSGGSDSTLVSAVAQKYSSQPIHSFSLGFENPDFDESRFALKASSQIGTQHHALNMASVDALEILPYVLRAFSEPLGDPSVFPTTFISKEARKFVTVVLTGDGADELFFGYGRYLRFVELNSLAQFLPSKTLRTGLSKTLSWLPKVKHMSRAKRIQQALLGNSDSMTYMSLIGFSHYNPTLNVEEFRSLKEGFALELWNRGRSNKVLNRLREIDVDSYLCDDILVKVDRAAMAFGLETRAPFLDFEVQALAKRADQNWLFTPENKAVIRFLLSQYISSDVFRRPKMGFGAPLGDWFSTSLRDWSYSVISDSDWEEIGIDRGFVSHLFESVINGRHQDSTYLWVLLALGYSSSSF